MSVSTHGGRPPSGPGVITTGLFDNDPEFEIDVKIPDGRASRVLIGTVKAWMTTTTVGQEEVSSSLLVRHSGNNQFDDKLRMLLESEGFTVSDTGPVSDAKDPRSQLFIRANHEINENSQQLLDRFRDFLTRHQESVAAELERRKTESDEVKSGKVRLIDELVEYTLTSLAAIKGEELDTITIANVMRALRQALNDGPGILEGQSMLDLFTEDDGLAEDD